MKKGNLSDCANCPLAPQEKICLNPEGKGVKGCPTLGKKKLTGQAQKKYQPANVREFARQASIQEGECYAGRDKRPYVMHPTKPRIREICEFSRKMGYTSGPGFLCRVIQGGSDCCPNPAKSWAEEKAHGIKPSKFDLTPNPSCFLFLIKTSDPVLFGFGCFYLATVFFVRLHCKYPDCFCFLRLRFVMYQNISVSNFHSQNVL